MKNLKNIEQNSIEWFEAKWGRIGGTLSKGLLVKTDTLLIDILGQHLEEFEMESDSFESSSMVHGKEMEPFALQFVEGYSGIKFEKTGLLISDENDLLCLSPDGISECERFAVETKCLQRKAHTKILFEEEIPLEYLPQLVHYFTVNPKLEKLYFCAFRTESVANFMRVLTPDSIVNLGTKARPVLKTVREWTKISYAEAANLKLELGQAIKQLKQI
jgi:hypothetical protein